MLPPPPLHVVRRAGETSTRKRKNLLFSLSAKPDNFFAARYSRNTVNELFNSGIRPDTCRTPSLSAADSRFAYVTRRPVTNVGANCGQAVPGLVLELAPAPNCLIGSVVPTGLCFVWTKQFWGHLPATCLGLKPFSRHSLSNLPNKLIQIQKNISLLSTSKTKHQC